MISQGVCNDVHHLAQYQYAALARLGVRLSMNWRDGAKTANL